MRGTLARMGDVIPNRRWTKASDYAPANRGGRWFAFALVVVPLAAFSAVFFAPSLGDGPQAEAAVGVAGPMDREEAYFPVCSGPTRETCVVDGDTIWYRGEKIRLVGFDTPETSNPGCAREARLGGQATLRLQAWLNEGAFSLTPNPEGRAEDRYGRSLLVASRGGANVAEVLLAEGLAERRGGRGNVWC